MLLPPHRMKPRHLNDGVDAMNCNIDDGGAVCLGNALAIDNKLRHLQNTTATPSKAAAVMSDFESLLVYSASLLSSVGRASGGATTTTTTATGVGGGIGVVGGGGDRTMKMMTMSGSMGNNNATTTSSYEAAASK